MDIYVVLGVQRGASLAEIKRAYRRLARRFHPDINPGDREAAARFRDVLTAYEILTDPDRRRRYDAGQMETTQAVEGDPFGFAGFDFSSRVHGERATTFGDLFEDVFGRQDRRERSTPETGADLHSKIELSFEQAWMGASVPVTVTRQITCATCVGKGVRAIAETACVTCQGTGAIRAARGHMVFARSCPTCGGAGTISYRSCEVCHGQGVTTHAETRLLTIPPGVPDGGRVRVEGGGHAGVRGGPPGDLHVEVTVQAHPLYRREGDDVHMTVPVAIHEAGLGAKIDVPTPDGPVRMRVPPGTQSGQRFRLRERGAPSMRDGRRGDLVVEAKLVLPDVIDERSKDLLREFGRLNADNVRSGLIQDHVGEGG